MFINKVLKRIIVGGVLFSGILIFGFTLYNGEPISDAELQYVEQSPVLGEDGGEILPASCASSPHFNYHCQMRMTLTPGACGSGSMTVQVTPIGTNHRVYRGEYGTTAYRTLGWGATSFVDTGLNPGQRYFYRYDAYVSDGGNAEGGSYYWTPWGDYYSAYAPQVCPPPAPTGVSASPGSCGTGQVYVSWNSSPRATNYRVYKYNYGTGNWEHWYNTGATYQWFSGLPAGSYNAFAVIAENAGGSSGWSNVAEGYNAPNVCPPPAVTGLTGTTLACGTGQIRLNWDASSGATSYVVHQVIGGVWTVIGSTGSRVYTVSGLSPGATYRFNVRASNAGGNSAFTTQVYVDAPPDCPPPPATPTGLVGTPAACGTGRINLDWDDMAGATSYKVYQWDGATWVLVYTPAVSARAVLGLSPNTSYRFSVSAVNSYGDSARTTAEVVTSPDLCPPDLVPSVPTPQAASVAPGGTITFDLNTILNSGGQTAGPHEIGGLYIDNNGDGVAEYTPNIARQANSTLAGDSYTRTKTWNVPLTAPGGNNYRVSYIVDDLNEIVEGTAGENNNFSGWSAPFSVVLPDCAATTINNCILPLTPTGGSSGSCTSGYAGTCSYSCGGGSGTFTQTSNSCAGPAITQFQICLWDGTTASSCGSSLTTATGTPLAIRWNSTNADNCTRQSGPADFSTGGAVSGIDTTVTASSLTNTTSTYVLICTRDGSGLSAVTRSVSNTTLNERPILTISRGVVNIGDSVIVSWDTNNANEGACTLTGGGLTTATLTNGTGDAETGSANVTIQGATTFVLTCAGQSDVEAVSIIPQEWEN